MRTFGFSISNVAATLSDDSRGCCGINGKIVAEIVCPSENAIVPARDRVHQRGVITNDGVWKIFDPRHNRDLAAMWLKIGIMDEFARANSGAVNHEIELWIYVFKFFEAHVFGDLTSGFQKAVRQIVEINGRVHQRNIAARIRSENLVADSLCRGASQRDPPARRHSAVAKAESLRAPSGTAQSGI